MKDLLGKEHYSYKIHTSLMQSSAPSSIDNPPIWIPPKQAVSDFLFGNTGLL